jgi:CHAT domain-containing protein/tetratricopeptide (TPR) repeat protein
MKPLILVWVGLTLLLALFPRQAQAQIDFTPNPDSVRLLNLINRFNIAGNAGKLDSAIYFARELASVTAVDYGELSHSHAVTLAAYLGYIYLVTNDFRNAFASFRKALDVFEKIGDTTNYRYADAVYLTGLSASQLQLNDLSEQYVLHSLALQKNRNLQYYCQGLLLLGVAAANRGDYEQALSWYLQCNDTVNNHRHDAYMNYLRSSLYNNMAIIYQQTGNPRKSLSYIQHSLILSRESDEEGFHNTQAPELLLNLAEAWLECGRPDSALLCVRRAEDSLLVPKNNDRHLYALIAMEKAAVFQRTNRLPEAITLSEIYLHIKDSLSEKGSDYFTNLITLGALYTDTRQFSRADSVFRYVIGEQYRQGLIYSFQLQQAISNLCSNLIDQRQYDEASDSLLDLIHLTLRGLRKNFSGLSENDQLKYSAGLADVFDLLYTCLYSQPNLRKEVLEETGRLEWQRQNLALTSQARFRSRIRNSRDTALQRLYADWLDNRQLLSAQYSLPADTRTFSVDSLEERSDHLEERLAGNVLPEPLARHLLAPSPGAADVGFVRFRYRAPGPRHDSVYYAAFIYRDSVGRPAFVHLCSEASLLRRIKGNNGRWINEDQATLYRLLWAPLEPWLNDIATINYSTAGLLNNIAIHALYDGKTFLSRRYTLHRYLSLADAGNDGPPKPGVTTVSLWGNMDFSNGPLLPLGAAEITSLSRILAANGCPYSLFEGRNATEENFKSRAPSINGILHITTHGFYIPFQKENERSHTPNNFISAIVDPLFRCGLAFSGANYYWLNARTRRGSDNGLLTGYEVAQLDLHQVSLVTLSACETGLGDVTDNEGNLGLQRAFRLAGADQLLVSLWQVPARQTSELLSLFYTNWLKGQSFSEALRNAQRSLQDKNYPPYYWAGFVLIE